VRDRQEIAAFVERLDRIIAELAKPDRGQFTHPLDAGSGDALEGGFIVHKRLGKGSTSVALLVEREGHQGVLKVALEPKLNERLRQEAAVLRRREVRHQNIVELYDEMELNGHVALFMARAGAENSSGTYTLAQRIREEGRLSLDLLQRFGEELLGVVDWLEQNGISHRDIKPDNIGIGQTPSKKLTLVLFDFSLSGIPAENVRAGTPPYLDPFLSIRKPPRWDVSAERFAAAVTLYEMASGELPEWGDGRSNPALVDDEVSLAVDRLDPAVREDLTRFFQKALARDHRRRFDNAEEMRRAWARVFEHIDQPITLTDPGESEPAALLEGASEDTPIVSLGLTPRVLNALERIGVHTVGELRDHVQLRDRSLLNLPGNGIRWESVDLCGRIPGGVWIGRARGGPHAPDDDAAGAVDDPYDRTVTRRDRPVHLAGSAAATASGVGRRAPGAARCARSESGSDGVLARRPHVVRREP
jgi:serine/threonine protein kinase